MIIYNYSPITGEFTGQSSAPGCPIDKGKFLIPAHATKKKPPITTDNQIAMFDIDSNSWFIEADFRGYYFESNGAPKEIKDIGIDLPEGCSQTPPNDGMEFPKFDGTKWVEDIDMIKQGRIIDVKDLAREKIVALDPDWTTGNYRVKQLNTAMRAVKLLRKEQKNKTTPEEVIELDNLDIAIEATELIRAASNSIEAEILVLTTKIEIEEYDVATNILWP